MRIKRSCLYKQQRANTCAVASLRTALALQYGVKIPERILEAHGTTARDPIVRRGTDTKQLREMVKGASRTHNVLAPWRLQVHQHGSIADLQAALEAGLFPLAQVWAQVDGATWYHLVVVVGCGDGIVRIWDPSPLIGGPYEESAESFIARWTLWYAVVTGRYRKR